MDNFNHELLESAEYKINLLIKSSYRLRYDIKRYNLIGTIILHNELIKQTGELENEKVSLPEQH